MITPTTTPASAPAPNRSKAVPKVAQTATPMAIPAMRWELLGMTDYDSAALRQEHQATPTTCYSAATEAWDS